MRLPSRLTYRIKNMFRRHATPAAAQTHSPLVIAHFFGDHDPFNFWTDQDLSRLPALLGQVRRDGFNAIILVVPRFPFLQDDPSKGMDSWYTERFERVLSASDEADLKVILRINYPHTSFPGAISDSAERVYNLFRDPATLDGFQTYCESLASISRRHPSFRDVFLCWEDIWYVFNLNEHPLETRQRWANGLGLAAFVEQANTKALDRNRARYRNLHWHGEQIPEPNTFENELWIAFFDHLLFDRLGSIARTAFGTVNFEVRGDRYPVKVGDQYEWIDFGTRATERDNLRYAYWAPYYGSRNNGEKLTSSEAIGRLRFMLDHLNAGISSPVVIEQFNFVDNTLAHSRNAQLADDEVEKFLGNVVDVLKESTGGYGIWAYRDYRENLLFNGTFQRGLEDWDAPQESMPMGAGGVRLLAGQRLKKIFSPAVRAQSPYALYQDFTLELDLVGDSAAAVSISVNGVEIGTLQSGTNKILVIPKQSINWDRTTIDVIAAGVVVVSRVAFYGYVQHGGIYDRFGKPDRYLPAIRALNHSLSTAKAA
jgi:hypothetical protein